MVAALNLVFWQARNGAAFPIQSEFLFGQVLGQQVAQLRGRQVLQAFQRVVRRLYEIFCYFFDSC